MSAVILKFCLAYTKYFHLHCFVGTTRIPIASSFAWRHYRTNWFALDAPRHFYLHTEESLSLLAERTGFTLIDTYHDATSQTIWASEQYMQDIPSLDTRSFRFGLEQSIFTQDEIDAFTRKTQELNNSHDGDQACFILKKKS